MFGFLFFFILLLLVVGSFFLGFSKGYNQVPDISEEELNSPNGLKQLQRELVANGIKEGKAWVIRTIVVIWLPLGLIAFVISWLFS